MRNGADFIDVTPTNYTVTGVLLLKSNVSHFIMNFISTIRKSLTRADQIPHFEEAGVTKMPRQFSMIS